MKKLVLILFFALIAGTCIFAASSASGVITTDGNNPTADTKVTLDLTESGDSYVELWFDGNASTSMPVSPKDGVELGFKTGESIATNSSEGSNDALYACWNIVSGDAINVELYMQDKLVNQTVGKSAEKIDWKATWDSKSISSDSITDVVTESSATLAEYGTDTNSKLGKAGQKSITISTLTTDFSKLSAGSYEAHLYLRCRAV